MLHLQGGVAARRKNRYQFGASAVPEEAKEQGKTNRDEILALRRHVANSVAIHPEETIYITTGTITQTGSMMSDAIMAPDLDTALVGHTRQTHGDVWNMNCF